MNRKTPVHLPEGYVDFFMSLESWQNEQQILLQRQLPQPAAPDIDFQNVQEPLLNVIDVEIDSDRFEKVYRGLVEFLRAHRLELASDLAFIDGKMPQFDWPALIEETMNENRVFFAGLGNLLGINPEVLFFTCEHSLRPFLRLYAAPYYQSWADMGVQHWSFPVACPFCGSEGHISRLRNEDGRRFMFCERCFTEWEVRYLFCVFCANDEPGTIRIMNLENDQAHKLYLCEKCKSYLKTYDERQTLQPADLYITSIQTIYLDMLAEEEGYGSKHPGGH